MKRFYLLTTVLFLALFTNAQLVSTYVGTGAGGYTASGTTRLSTNIEQPWGSALDSKGNVWITTEGGHEIKMLQTSTGNVLIRSGAYGLPGLVNAAGVTARFYNPRGVAVGPGDTIFIADFNNCAVRKMTPYVNINPQTITTLAGKYTGTTILTPVCGYVNGNAATAQFDGPSDVAVDASGNVYVADFNNHAIRKVTRAGVVTTLTGKGPSTFGSTDGTLAQATFKYPSGLYLDGNDTLYVADNGNGKIRKIAISGNSVTTVVSGLTSPNDVIISNRVLYITDQHRIRKYSISSSTLSTFAGSSTVNDFGNVNAYGTNARFNNVRGIFLNATDGYIWVADQDNHYIKRVSICSTITPSITLSGNDTICQGGSTTLTGPAGYKYLWSNGKTTQSINVTIAGTYTLSVQNNSADSCMGTSSPVVITVINPTITYTTPLAFCNGNYVILKGPAGYKSYSWSDGVKTQNDTVRTSDTLTLTLENFCTSLPVKTRVKPVPTSTFSCNSSICINTNLTVTYSGSAASTGTYTWAWDLGTATGSGVGPYSVNWNTAGNKIISCQVTDTNGCTSVLTKDTITVSPLPTSVFTVSKTSVCPLDHITINYTGSGVASDSYNWNFGGGTASGSGKGPYDVYWTISGLKSVSLVVTDSKTGCMSTLTSKNVQVNPIPSSALSAKRYSILVYEFDTIYHSGKKTGDTITWDFNSPDQYIQILKDSSYKVAWFTPGTKTIKITVNNKCTSIDSIYIVVNQSGVKPISDFAANVTTIYQGQSVNFTDNSANSPTSWKWTFTGGTPASSTIANPSVTYNTAGIYDVKLEATNAYGTDIKTRTAYITVNSTPQKPVANFYASATTITQGGTVTFTDISTNTPTAWKWTFQNGSPLSSTSATQIVQYNSTGTFDVKLVATNSNGSDSIIKNAYITVNPAGQKPVANFSTTATTIAQGGTVTFTDISTNTPTAWKWTFQSGSPLSSANAYQIVQYNSTGTFDVKLVVTNSYGSDSIIKNAFITVNSPGQKPVADFSANKTSIKAGQTVTFTDLSTNSPTSLKWSFQGGTPSTSVLTSPIITYNTVGTYNVQLIAINAGGSDTTLKTAYINVGPVGLNDRNEDTKVRFYPSPVKDKLNIEIEADSKISSIEVLDITGRIKYVSKYSVNGTLINLDLTSLPKGLYILRISGEGMNFTGKFSKE